MSSVASCKRQDFLPSGPIMFLLTTKDSILDCMCFLWSRRHCEASLIPETPDSFLRFPMPTELYVKFARNERSATAKLHFDQFGTCAFHTIFCFRTMLLCRCHLFEGCVRKKELPGLRISDVGEPHLRLRARNSECNGMYSFTASPSIRLRPVYQHGQTTCAG